MFARQCPYVQLQTKSFLSLSILFSSFIHAKARISIMSLFYFDGTGVYIQGLALARQALYHLNHTISPTFFF
jgi:hypothetical protein